MEEVLRDIPAGKAGTQPRFPATRFQGSKFKLADWIWEGIKDLEFDTALDAFGGTGSIGYLLKLHHKQVTYNDLLKFNWHIGRALIENDRVVLSDDELDALLQPYPGRFYPTFIQDTFHDIYFTDAENRWIDMVVTNIGCLTDPFRKALAFFALFQTCLAKRPFNLFHRKNLYLRFSDVPRNFGNKATWDAPCELLFRKFASAASNAVFCNGLANTALNQDVFQIEGSFDLVYIDPPYLSGKGVGVNYYQFYHFLEGLAQYDVWGSLIDYSSKHRRLKGGDSAWIRKDSIYEAFDKLFARFQESVLVVSYRADGIPKVGELIGLLRKYKAEVKIMERREYQYALSGRRSGEVLFIGR